MRNHESRDGDAGSEKHSCQDQSNHAKRDPEPRTLRGWLSGQGRGCKGRGGFAGGLGCQRCARSIGAFRWHSQTIAFPRNRLDVQRLIRGVAQYLAEFVYRRVYVGVVVDMRVGGPESLPQFLAGDDLTWLFE